MRPGFGYPLDEWRVEQLWPLFDDGIQYVNESQVWSEWWTLWRRAAGGLDEERASARARRHGVICKPPRKSRHKRPSGPCEDRLRPTWCGWRHRSNAFPSSARSNSANRLLTRLKKPAENPQSWWAVGRIGARRPFYGSAHGVVPPDIAAAWLDAILALDWKKVDPAAFAAVQIARMTGDRSRDLPEDVRAEVVRRLEAANAPRAGSPW